jgi:dinuclear metal center YbgI/SA1388 family protein
MDTEELADHLNAYLRVTEVPDAEVAENGLQVANSGAVTRIAAAVDASQATIDEAVRRGCDLLLVHHGLFWDGRRPVTGRRYGKLRKLIAHDVAVYSAHIPLDVHPEVGNCAVLARELGIAVDGTFGDYRGEPLGVMGALDTTRDTLTRRLEGVLGGPVRLIAGGGAQIRRVGVITGGGGGMIGDAVRAGLDAYVTGEGAHHTYFDATEGGINVYYGGHYATETWGVRALASHIEARYGVPWEWIDQPTGL